MKKIISIVCCLLTFAVVAWAQTAGSIRGEVTEADGKPIPGATITISSSALIGGTKTTYTNELGTYRFPSIPIGTYSVQVTMEGFETLQASNVNVGINATATVPFSMKISTMAEKLTVLGETPVIDVTESGLSTSYSKEMLTEVPTQRSMTDLIQLTPGVAASFGDSGGDRTIAYGSNMQSNSWNVDGVDLTAPETGSVWYTVNPDQIEEIQVMGIGAPAEYGNFTGGVFNVVTKKGGNIFHGSANYFYQGDSLTDTNIRLTDCCDNKESETFNLVKYRSFSAQMGGPILKDKLWFFGGYSYGRNASTDPGADPAFAPINKSDKYDVKVTGLLGQNNEVSGFYHFENFAAPDSASLQYAPSALGSEDGHNPGWGASLTSTISSNLLLEANYAGWNSTDIYDSQTGSLEDPFFDYSPPDGGPAQYTGGVYYPFDYRTGKQQYKAKLTYYAQNFLNSQHEFRFGVQGAKGDANTDAVGIGSNGTYGYHYLAYNYDTYQYEDRFYRAYQLPYQYGGTTHHLGFFADDTVTVNDRLTLNLGIRFDHNTADIPDYQRLGIGTPSFTPIGNFIRTDETIPGFKNYIRWNNVSPRVGFVLQTREGGKSVLQGSFGVYYDHNVSGNWDYPPPQLPTFRLFQLNPDTGLYDILIDEISVNDVNLNPNIDPPRALQYSVGYDHQIGDSIALGAQYVYKDTKDLVGWQILGGSWTPVDFVDPVTGTHYTLLNKDQDNPPILQKGNSPGDFCDHIVGGGTASMCADAAKGYFQKYHALLLTFEKRFSGNWGLNASYTWSRSTGLIPRMLSQTQFNPFYSGRDGSDPNNFTNADGRLQGDRPHMFRVQGVFFKLPADLQASVSADFSSGRHHVRQFQVPLDQGLTRVILERDLRLSTFKVIDVTIGKRINIGDQVQIRLEGTIFNLLNSNNELSLADLALDEGEQFTADSWTKPRRLQLRVGFQF